MAKGIVDRLEMIDVDQNQRTWRAFGKNSRGGRHKLAVIQEVRQGSLLILDSNPLDLLIIDFNALMKAPRFRGFWTKPSAPRDKASSCFSALDSRLRKIMGMVASLSCLMIEATTSPFASGMWKSVTKTSGRNRDRASSTWLGCWMCSTIRPSSVRNFRAR